MRRTGEKPTKYQEEKEQEKRKKVLVMIKNEQEAK
jgi:hypothetical protein